MTKINYNIKIVILAGGLGTRLEEYTKHLPKPMVIVDKKPTEVGVDPYNKLIDVDTNDNRREL